MIKLLLFIAISIASSINILSQDIIISFAATGESTTVDEVKATNLTSKASVTIPGSESLTLTQNATGILDVLNETGISVSPNMKEPGTTHWKTPNTGADNRSGFTALPSGGRDYGDYGGEFMFIGEGNSWWSSSSIELSGYHLGYMFVFRYNMAGLDRSNKYAYMSIGFHVRCVKN